MTEFNSALARILTIGMLVACSGFATAQQAYPTKPIRVIVPYPTGGSVDNVARLIGQKLSESWGQQVIVDNRGGGNTIIGTEAVAKSPPDGYTLLMALSTLVINPNLFPKLPYDAIRDFIPIATVGSTEMYLVVHPSVAANNLQEFIALAKSKPGQLNHASVGIGSPTHLANELFNIMTGVKIQNVPYKGGGLAITDLIGGQVQVVFQSPISVVPHVKSGRIKAIAFSGETRLSALPQVPTFAEAGLPGFDVKSWFGLLVPAGTPKEIIDKLSTEVLRIAAMPDTKEKLLSQGLESFVSTPDQFAALMKADLAKYAKLIKAANIKLEQ